MFAAMRPSTILLIAAAGLGVMLLLGKGLGASTLGFSFRSVYGLSMSGLNFILKLEFTISNPSNTNFDVKGISGNISVNGSVLGNVADYTRRVISARSAQNVIIPFTISVAGLGSVLMERIKGNTSQVLTVSFDGFVNESNNVVPVHTKFSL